MEFNNKPPGKTVISSQVTHLSVIGVTSQVTHLSIAVITGHRLKDWIKICNHSGVMNGIQQQAAR